MNNRHALICAPLMPEFDRESGSRRIFDLIEFLRQSGWSVSFVARQADGAERYIRLLQQRGVAVYVGFDSRLEQLISAARIDLAILAFWHAAEEVLPLLRALSPGTPILVDSIDLHFLRNARATLQRRDEQGGFQLLSEKFAGELRRELNVYAAADGVLTVSAKEAELINDLLNDSCLAQVVPDAEDIPASPLSFAQRQGILFIGNFRHAPNVGAVEYFCREIVPLLDPHLLAEHPVSIVGNGLTEAICNLGRGLPNAKMVGWVPSVQPYLNQARVKVIPLLCGAGTKRKLIQALMTGTPAVSTTIGIEGLRLQHEEQVLVADDPLSFAKAVERLLIDESLWERLASRGRAHVTALHDPASVGRRLQQAIAAVLGKPVKPAPPAGFGPSRPNADPYHELIGRVQQVAQAALPSDAKVLVVSKGDDRLLQLAGRTAAHFPQAAGGGYAGHYPATGIEAVGQLTSLCGQGSEYLLFPATSSWWLDHYAELRQHLETHGQRVHSDESCQIFRLHGTTALKAIQPPQPTTPPEQAQTVGQDFFTSVQPKIDGRVLDAATRDRTTRKRILIYGVYLSNQPNTAEHVIATLGDTRRHDVTQRWVGLFGEPASQKVADATVCQLREKTPKFKILNELLAQEKLADYDYILLTDDDIVLPEGFLDAYIGLQSKLEFAICQPARTSNSYIDHPIVEQQQGVLARRTMFVEIGPVVSFHRSCFDMVLPFDLTSPMGWGYESVWSRQLALQNLKMGIIDATPVDHSLRKPVANYSWTEANNQRKSLLLKRDHYPLDQCFRVLEVIALPGNDKATSYAVAAH